MGREKITIHDRADPINTRFPLGKKSIRKPAIPDIRYFPTKGIRAIQTDAIQI
jgi:hypothetical protein